MVFSVLVMRSTAGLWDADELPEDVTQQRELIWVPQRVIEDWRAPTAADALGRGTGCRWRAGDRQRMRWLTWPRGARTIIRSGGPCHGVSRETSRSG